MEIGCLPSFRNFRGLQLGELSVAKVDDIMRYASTQAKWQLAFLMICDSIRNISWFLY